MWQNGTINREPHTYTLHAIDLNWLIQTYVEECRTKLDNQFTVDCYASKLQWFTSWWNDTGPRQLWMLHQSDLIAFERHLRSVKSAKTKRPLAWHTRNDVLRRLREMFHWAKASHYTDRDYADWVPRASGGPPKRRALSVTDLIRLLAAADQSTNPLRDKAMAAVMMGMGLRRVEVVNLNIEDVVIEADMSGYAHVFGKRTRANHSGERDAAFDAPTGKLLAAHLDQQGFQRGPLFRNPEGKRLSAQGVYRAVKKMAEAAGLADQMQACHDLRRAFATYSARNAKDKDAADRRRRQLGHASFSQTAEYELLDVEDLRRNFISPMGAMPASLLRSDDEAY